MQEEGKDERETEARDTQREKRKMRQIERHSKTQKPVQRARERRDEGEAEWKEANTCLKKEAKKPAERLKNPGGCRLEDRRPSADSRPLETRFLSLGGSELSWHRSFLWLWLSGEWEAYRGEPFRPGLCAYFPVMGLSG